jgi:hypothetical protein
MYVFMETLNARARTTFTKDARWFSLFDVWNKQQPARSQYDSGVLHVVELFLSLLLRSSRAWIGESNNICVVINTQVIR